MLLIRGGFTQRCDHGITSLLLCLHVGTPCQNAWKLELKLKQICIVLLYVAHSINAKIRAMRFECFGSHEPFHVTSWVKISLVLWGTHQLCTKWLVLEGLFHLEQSVGNHESSATLSNIVIENFNFTPKDEVSKEDLTSGSLQEIMNALS